MHSKFFTNTCKSTKIHVIFLDKLNWLFSNITRKFLFISQCILKLIKEQNFFYHFSGITFKSSEAEALFSTSTSRHLSRRSWKTGESLCFSLISGLPLVAMRYSACKENWKTINCFMEKLHHTQAFDVFHALGAKDIREKKAM